jgi:hypothetical protein
MNLPSRQRSAIEGLDENDLSTRLQRSSDQLRTGQFSDPAEAALTSDLQKLGHDVTDAARSLGSAGHTSEEAGIKRAMDDLSRLRDQLRASAVSQVAPVNRIRARRSAMLIPRRFPQAIRNLWPSIIPNSPPSAANGTPC